MKWQPEEKSDDQLDKIHLKDWWKVHELKNYIFRQLKQSSALIQAQHVAIAYPPGNKGMKYILTHPKTIMEGALWLIIHYIVGYVIKICLCLLQNLFCIIWKANMKILMLCRWNIQ